MLVGETDHARSDEHDRSTWGRVLERPLLTNLAVLAGYVLLSIWLWKAVVPHMATRMLGGGLSDPGLFLWWLRWAPFALLHGHNPFFTGYLNAPAGASAMWNTSILVVGWVFLPVTELFGVVVTFNLVCILGPALSAWTCSIWLRRHARLFPSVVGGLLFGFSPFVIQEGIGHLHLVWLCLLPVIAMLVEDVVWRSPRPWWPRGPLLGVVVAAQLLISSEVLLMTVMAMALAVIALGAMHPSTVRARLKPAALGLGSGAAVACAIVGWPVVNQFSSGQVIRGPIQGLGFVGEPEDLVRAPASVFLHTSASAAFAGRLVGFENGLYLGIPLVAAVVLSCILVRRRRKLVLSAAIVAAVFVVFSFGRRLRAPSGYSGPLLPWGYIERTFHLTENILPVRFAIVIWLAVSLIVAIGLDEMIERLRGRSITTLSVGLVAAVCLAPLVPVPRNGIRPLAGTPTFFTTSEVRQIPQGSVALVVPIPTSADDSAMLWQVRSGMRFKQVGGYVLHPLGPKQHGTFAISYPTLSKLLSVQLQRGPGRTLYRTVFSDPVTPSLRSQALRELRETHARTVVVGGTRFATYGQLVGTVEQILGRPPDQVEGGVALWRW